MNLEHWDFDLPPEQIARRPTERRDGSRLMVVPRDPAGKPDHRQFVDLPDILRPGDLLIANDTRVMAARVPAERATGARLELLVLQPGPGPVECLIKNARRLKDGEVIQLPDREATVLRRTDDGAFLVDLGDVPSLLDGHGELPLPPYLEREADSADTDRYQTLFAGPLGAAAAPTAGLHFTPEVLEHLRIRGVRLATVTLHVGIGTFRPLRQEDLDRGELHPERWNLPVETASAITETRAAGGRVIAIGTTSARTLEAAADDDAVPRAGSGTTRIFLHPERPPRTIDGLLTNFHLPRSSLLLLVASLIDRERLLDAYQSAIHNDYRFYSYGDAMLLL